MNSSLSSLLPLRSPEVRPIAFNRPFMARHFAILVPALFASELLAQTAPTIASPYLESCGTLSFTRTTVDSVAVDLSNMSCTKADTSAGGDEIIPYLGTRAALEPSPVPVPIVLRTPRLVRMAHFSENFESDTISIVVAIVNSTRSAVRLPAWLYVSTPGAKVNGTWLRAPEAWRIASLGFDLSHEIIKYEWADAPSPFQTQHQSFYRVPARGAAEREIARLQPGDTSAMVTLRFHVRPQMQAVRFRMATRALPVVDEIPAVIPESLSPALLDSRRLISLDSVAVPFVRDLIRIRLVDTVDAATRQLLLDRVGGLVVGKLDGDLVVKMDSSRDARVVLQAWSRWQMQLNYAVIRRIGVVSTDSIMDQLARTQGHWPTTDSALPGVLEDVSRNYPKAHLEVERSPGTSSRDFWRALATVGARPVAQIDAGEPGAETVIALLDHDSSYAAHIAAARQLRWLVELGQVAARKAADSTASSDLIVPFHPPPPRNEGTAWQDQRVRRFVAQANLPNLHAIQDALYLKAYDIVFFSAIYGSPREVYLSRTGLRVGDRIGWLEISQSPDSVGSRFQFRTDDRFLQGPFLDTLLTIDRRKNGYPYLTYNHYLPTLVSQPTVTPTVL